MGLRAGLLGVVMVPSAVACADIIGADFGDYSTRRTGDAGQGGAHDGTDAAVTGGGSGRSGAGGATSAAGHPGDGGTNGTGGGQGASGASGAPGGGGASGMGAAPSTGGLSGTGDAGGPCAPLDLRPDVVVHTVYEPIALFIMIDRSGSMISGFPPPASPDSWNNAAAAISAFVNDPASGGIDVGLGSFPYGPNNTASCADGADCGTAIVPIAPLPGNAAAITQAMQQQAPANPIAVTPTECGIRGMINRCLTFSAGSPTGERCVAVLATDGSPTQCDTVLANLVSIVAQGSAQGVRTFTLALPGADLAFLNQLAQAGGTGAALGTQTQSAFLDALNAVRGRVTTGTTVQLECRWAIPPPPGGLTFDPTRVNFKVTPPSGPPIHYDHVAREADCSRTANQNGWYYGAGTTQVFACPRTCDAFKSSGGSADLEFGCSTREARLQ